jgi:hypothetical protein
MNLRPNISKAFFRKAFCVTIGLLLSLNFFAGAALAKSCDGGLGCLSCEEAVHHRHRPAMNRGAAPSGCQPLDQEGACGFEIGPDTDNFHGIIPTVRTDQNTIEGSFAAIAFDESPDRSTGKLLRQPLYSDTIPITPIYLIIQSLLC